MKVCADPSWLLGIKNGLNKKSVLALKIMKLLMFEVDLKNMTD